MKKIKCLKLGSIDRNRLNERELINLQGGNYCAYGWANNYANTDQGLCSGSSDAPASFLKNTTGWGRYC